MLRADLNRLEESITEGEKIQYASEPLKKIGLEAIVRSYIFKDKYF
jgi:hypothetical protein